MLIHSVTATDVVLFIAILVALGVLSYFLFKSFLKEYFKTKEIINREYQERLSDFEDMYIETFPGRTRAFVKIQDGCDNFCT